MLLLGKTQKKHPGNLPPSADGRTLFSMSKKVYPLWVFYSMVPDRVQQAAIEPVETRLQDRVLVGCSVCCRCPRRARGLGLLETVPCSSPVQMHQ